MSLFESIFGSSHSQTDLIDTRTQGLANQAFNNAYGQYAQQQSMNSAQNQLAGQAYNQALMGQYHIYKDKPKWVYNGCECSLKEFTELMWPDDEQARLMFILKHGGV
jgi:hypothetical protein